MDGENTEYVRRGDYLVPKDDLERAEDAFEERSPRSQAIDKAFRGPITSDIERYEDSGGRIFDYPGVDTPTDSPSHSAEDFPFPDERRDFAAGRDPNGMRVDTSRSDASLTRMVEDMGTQGRSMIDAFFGTR